MDRPKIWLTDDSISNFAGNDYLGMAKQEGLAEALYEAAKKYGISPTSSRWGLGWTKIFEDLERKIASYYGVADSTIFGAAYLGGLIYFGSMRKFSSHVYCDEMCHVNLFKGMNAHGYQIHRYKHLNVSSLKELLKDHKEGTPLIVSDGLWGISGEVPPLQQISEVVKEFKGEMLVDDAHGVFHMGKNGRGVAEYCGLEPEDATILGSMSKALGCGGGFLVGREELVDLFRRNDTTSGTSTMAIPLAAACLKAIEVLEKEPIRRDVLTQIALKMRAILLKKDIKTVDSRSPILGMEMKDEFEAQKLSEHFMKYKIAIPYFKYASEPRHHLLRGVAKSSYTEEQLQTFEKAILTFER